jgi:hypothetical protein
MIRSRCRFSGGSRRLVSDPRLSWRKWREPPGALWKKRVGKCVRIQSNNSNEHFSSTKKILSSSDPHPDPLFWHIIVSDIPSGSHWHILWDSFWHSIWHLFWHTFWHIFWHSFWHSIWHGISSDILSGILSGISSETLCGWGPAGRSLIQNLSAVRVRRGTLRSNACSWGPAGNPLNGKVLFNGDSWMLQ